MFTMSGYKAKKNMRWIKSPKNEHDKNTKYVFYFPLSIRLLSEKWFNAKKSAKNPAGVVSVNLNTIVEN